MKTSWILPFVVCAWLWAAPAAGQSVRVLKLSDGVPFQMGKVTSVRIVHPDMGAKRLTLNYSTSEPGHEFSQHAHDYSDDTIVVLEGQGDLRQGDSRRPLKAGQSAFVPAGQVHGTVTTEKAIMISFQTPPDMVLYTGARDSAKPGAAPPKGEITPGAVRFLDYAGRSGFFVHPGMGAERVAAAHRKLGPGEGFQTGIGEGGEQVLFVWKGAIWVSSAGKRYEAGERDTVFVTGPARLEVGNGGKVEAVVIEAQAPPYGGW